MSFRWRGALLGELYHGRDELLVITPIVPTSRTLAEQSRVLTPLPRPADAPVSGFFSPAMRNSIILITASVLIWPYLPSRKTGSASPSASPSSFSSVAADSESPAVTRWLAKNTPDAKVWTERNDKHLELTKEAAEERLLFQEAERPRVWRLRNTA